MRIEDSFESIELARIGSEGLSATELNSIEQLLGDSPESNINLRFMLIGFYLIGKRTEPRYTAKYIEHIVWLIDHLPEHLFLCSPFVTVDKSCDGSLAYETVEKSWCKQIELNQSNPIILYNAAVFFMQENVILARQYLSRASSILPNDEDIERQLKRAKRKIERS